MAMHGRSTLQAGDERSEKDSVARYTPNPNLQNLRGDIDGVVFRKDGTAFRYDKPHDPKTPLQMSSRERMRIVNDAWDLVSPQEAEGWRAYATLLTAGGMRSDSGRPWRGYDLFCGLGCKYLQIHGGTTVPTAAPERLFLGDAVIVVAESAPGAVRFRVNGPNGPDALTELLLQPLKRASNRPQADRYRTQSFVAFESNALPYAIEVKPGAYAAAVRYVLAPTGQATAILRLGVVVVPAV